MCHTPRSITQSCFERMPSRTRMQSSTKAADTSNQEPGAEHPQDVEAKPILFNLPPELRKTVVEYVSTTACLSSMSTPTDSHPARPLVRLAEPLPSVKRDAHFDASIPVPRCYIENCPVGPEPSIDLHLESPRLVAHPDAAHRRTRMALILP
jgi:hypothetical protein